MVDLMLRADRIEAFLCMCKRAIYHIFNPLPDKPILGSSDSTSNKDMMSKLWTYGDTVI